MRSVLVDTSAWYPIAVPDHADHEALSTSLRSAVRDGVSLVTTNLIVAESYALLLSRVGRRAALGFLHAVRQPPNRIEYSTPPREAAAIDQWLARFHDQRFSFTDAVSFVVMRELGIHDAITLDRHFATAGFNMMPG